MLFQIASFVLDVVAGLVGGACLLRLVMQRQRIPFGNPVGRLVFALTDWIVLPLRRIVPNAGGWDLASLLAAFLVELAQYLLLWLLAGMSFSFADVLVLAAFGLLRLAVSTLIALLIGYAVLSWVQPQSPIMVLLDRIVAPVLQPFRRAIPLVGGVDLSPLVLLVVLQVVLMVLGHVQASALAAF